jgi:hypothetical protein
MSADQIVSQYPAEYAKFADALPGQSVAWLRLLRQDAAEQFSANGLQHVKNSRRQQQLLGHQYPAPSRSHPEYINSVLK